MTKLTPKRKRFCQEYMIDHNATQAAIRAGYSKNGAKVRGSHLLTLINIQVEIKKLTEKLTKKNEISAQYVLDSLHEVSQRCLQKKPVMVFDKEKKCMVQATEKDDNEVDQGVWTFDSSGANRSLELLGKYHSMFTDKTKHEISGDLTIKVEVTEEDE